jgi:hypothetical protein
MWMLILSRFVLASLWILFFSSLCNFGCVKNFEKLISFRLLLFRCALFWINRMEILLDIILMDAFGLMWDNFLFYCKNLKKLNFISFLSLNFFLILYKKLFTSSCVNKIIKNPKKISQEDLKQNKINFDSQTHKKINFCLLI